MTTTLLDPSVLLRALGDPPRLRAMALLELEELSVGELARVLGMAQSRVSNHLRVLRDAGLLIERHLGTKTHLRSALTAGGEQEPLPYPVQVWRGLRPGLAGLPEHQVDRSRLAALVVERRAARSDFFDRVAGNWDEIGDHFANGQARQRAAAALLPPGLVLADLGCGTGYFGRALLGLARRLICVDASPGMLDAARKSLATASAGTEVEFRQGDLDELPIATDELDGAVAGMVLHHLERLESALAEIRRVVRPGGTVVVVELAPHRETWMHEVLGDRQLGLAEAEVAAALTRAGFTDLWLASVDDRYSPRASADDEPSSLPLYIARGRVPSGHPS